MGLNRKDEARAFALLFGRWVTPGEVFAVTELDLAYYLGLHAIRPGLWHMLRTWWGG